jgi:sodium transport system permease protein
MVRWFTVASLFRTEVRMLLRDRRTIVMSVVIPAVVLPLVLTVSRRAEERRARQAAERVYRYAVVGPRADEARRLLAALRADRAAGPATPFRSAEVETPDPVAALARGEVDFYLEAGTAADLAARGATPRGRGGSPADATDTDRRRLADAAPDATRLTLVFRGDREASRAGARRLRDLLADTRRETRARLLAARGLPVDARAIVPLDLADLASTRQVAGLTLGRLLTPLLLLFLFSGGAVVAVDTLAGEKERGTLETLLTTAATRAEIVAAKLALVLAVALLITTIQVGNLLLYVGFQIIPAGESFRAAVPPPVAAGLLLLYLPVAVLVASVLLLVSGHARSYKEAQLYFFPVFLVGLLPGLAAWLPALPLRSAILALPVANISVAVKELLVGRPDPWGMAVAWFVTAGAAVAATAAVTRTLQTEHLIVPTAIEPAERLGGPALFGRDVLRWFAVLWALLLIVAANTEGRLDLRVQLLVNLVGVMLGGSLFLLWRYRLPVREALALRPVHPAAWVAVLAGAPAGLLTGIAVFRLANLLFPVDPRVLESFSQYLVPRDIPFWHLFPLVTLLPGVCEELTFRGVLIYGLHRRLRPAVLVLVVGLVFGLFHMSLFRLVPAAYLGALFAAATLLTGSIFPAMLWHALNNAIALLAGRAGLALAQLEPGAYAAAVGVLVLAFWILWRTRRPYPGLRT